MNNPPSDTIYHDPKSNSSALRCKGCGGWVSAARQTCRRCDEVSNSRKESPLLNQEQPLHINPWQQILSTPKNLVPSGTSFADSPRYRSEAEIREEYRTRIEREQNPQITPIELPSPKKGRIIGISHVGDIHVGTDACTYDAFRQMLKFVEETDDEYIALQGDMGDFLTSQSVGVMAEQSMPIIEQIKLIRSDLEPLARLNKILWMLRGNHEDRMDKATKNIVDPAQWIAQQLDVRYLATEGYTFVKSSGVSYTSYNIHGFSAGRRPGSRRNKMEDMLLRMGSDVVTCGHNHHLDFLQLMTQELDLQTMRPFVKQRWGIYTGTYHSYHGYPANAGLTAGPLGCVRLAFDVSTGMLLPQILPVVNHRAGYVHMLPA